MGLAGGGGSAAAASPGFMLGLGKGLDLAWSCNNASDRLIPAENTHPTNPRDGFKCTIPHAASKTQILEMVYNLYSGIIYKEIETCSSFLFEDHQGMQSRDSCVLREQTPALRYCLQEP